MTIYLVWYEGEIEGKTVTMLWGIYRFIADAQATQKMIIDEYGYPAHIVEEIAH